MKEVLVDQYQTFKLLIFLIFSVHLRKSSNNLPSTTIGESPPLSVSIIRPNSIVEKKKFESST